MTRAIVSLTLDETRDGKRILQVLLDERTGECRYFPFLESRGRMQPAAVSVPEILRARDVALAEVDRVVDGINQGRTEMRGTRSR